MMSTEAAPDTACLTGIAPQFLVDNLDTAIGYYRDKLGSACHYVTIGQIFLLHSEHAPIAEAMHPESQGGGGARGR